MEEKEQWKPVVGYERLYEVSNLGRVKSLNYNHTGKERLLKAWKNKDGYMFVVLMKDGVRKTCTVHRLVATAFITNHQGLPIINHKDENPENNKVNNLEWCSYSYNNSYNNRAKKVGEKTSKPIFGISKINGLIVEYRSAKEAGKVLNIAPTSITACCKGKKKSAGGYVWHYLEDQNREECQ